MPNSLGRDQLWTPQVWANIDKAVLDEVGSIRVMLINGPLGSMPRATALFAAGTYTFLGAEIYWTGSQVKELVNRITSDEE